MKGILKSKGDQPIECVLTEDDRIQPCWALSEQLGSSYDRGTRQQGLKLVSLVNVETHEHSRDIIIAKSNGLKATINFCPFCATPLLSAVLDLIAERKLDVTSSEVQP